MGSAHVAFQSYDLYPYILRCFMAAEKLSQKKWGPRGPLSERATRMNIKSPIFLPACGNGAHFFFLSLTPFCRDRSQVKELFYWSASRHWDWFYTGQSPDVQSPRQSPLTNQGGCGGSRLGCVGSGGSCARRSLRDGGSPSRS